MMLTLSPPKLTAPCGGDEPFSSPLFRELAASFGETSRRVILEPGATSQGILELLQGKRCRLLVANASRALSELNEASPETEMLARELGLLIPRTDAEKIDTVLCWDLLNYFSPPLLRAFAERLSAIMSPGGRVHAYIHSAAASMPRYPQRYTLVGEDLVARLDHDPAVRQTPRYSFRDLEKHTGGWRVERSMLLRNGIQEYLLCVDPDR